MKLFLTLTALALLSTGALASKEICVSRTLSTNYNDGLNGAVSTVCSAVGYTDKLKECKTEK